MLLALASITGPLVDLATNLIGSLGLAGIVILNTMTGVIGVPGTEPTMLFAGFNVYDGHLTLIGIIVAGVIGDMLGAASPTRSGISAAASCSSARAPSCTSTHASSSARSAGSSATARR